MKLLSVALVLGLTGSALAIDESPLPAGLTSVPVNTSAQRPVGSMTAAEIQAFSGDRAFSGDTYRVGAAWINAAGTSGARWVNNAAIDPSLNTFDGITEFYAGGAATQLGFQAAVAEFEGVLPNGNNFLQISIFSAGGQDINATGAGFPQLIMTLGEGVFVGDPVDTLFPKPGGVSIVSIDFGFFNGATFLGSASGGDVASTATDLDIFGFVNVGTLGPITEMFLFVEYSKIPTPGALGLFGIAGLAAFRRRR